MGLAGVAVHMYGIYKKVKSNDIQYGCLLFEYSTMKRKIIKAKLRLLVVSLLEKIRIKRFIKFLLEKICQK